MKKVLTCVHDVTPLHFARLRAIDSFLCESGVKSHYSMLVVPDYWRQWPLQDHPEFVSWLKERVASGVELVLHGCHHRDEQTHGSALSRWKATTLTDREGEFLGLEYQEARRRLMEGKELLEALLGQEIRGFVAPAWLYSPGTRKALRDLSFEVSEDHWKIWSPVSPEVRSFAPALSYATRDGGRILASLLGSRLATVLARPFPLVRFAIHPRDSDVESVNRESRRALASLLRLRQPVQYGEIVADWTNEVSK
jgi:predicted deacetylase